MTAGSATRPTATRPTAPRASAPARRDALLLGVRVVLGVFGAFKLYGTVWFTFFATAAQGGDPQGVVDWLVAVWSFVLATALVVAAVSLRRRDRRVAGVVVGLLAVEVLFSFVKLTAYDEPEALGFMAVDLVLAGLLALAVRRRAAAPGR
jgi:hypothetical protein